MTYKVEETQFWGGNLGYAKPVVKSSLGGGNVAAIAEDFQYVTKAPPGGYIETVKALRETIQDLTKAGRPAVDSDFIKPTQAVKFDEGKLPLNLLSTEAMNQTAAVLGFGATKYSANNWRSGFKWSRPLAAAMRHITAFNNGEDKDPESGLSHLSHAACCIMFLLEFEKTHPELDDRYKAETMKPNVP